MLNKIAIAIVLFSSTGCLIYEDSNSSNGSGSGSDGSGSQTATLPNVVPTTKISCYIGSGSDSTWVPQEGSIGTGEWGLDLSASCIAAGAHLLVEVGTLPVE
jgi:hypothetical protein